MASIQIRGANYHYDLSGQGEETLVFSHGFLMDSGMFRHQLDYFKDRYRILIFDWRGQGKSEVTPDGYDMDDLYLDAVELLEKLNLSRVHWTGVSMGGFIGMRLAARNPDLLRSLTLVDTSDEEEIPSKKIKWGILSYIFKFFGAAPATKGIQKALFGQTSLTNESFQSVLKEYAEKWKNLDRQATFKIAWAIFNRKAVTDELKKINTPAMIIVGEEDIARPYEEAVRLMKRIPGARLQTIPEAGHSSPLEQPMVFNRVLENFLRRIESKES